MRSIMRAACYLLAALAIVLTSTAGAGEIERETLRRLADGYARNREAFPVIDCRFDCVVGKAASIDEALRGRPGGDLVVYNGQWLVNGARVRYELFCDPVIAAADKEFVRKNPQPAQGNLVPTVSKVLHKDVVYLRDESYSLRYAPRSGPTVNIFPKGVQDGSGIRVTPFNPDILGADEYSNPERYLRDVLNGRFKGRLEGTQQINGIDTVVVTIGDPWSNKFGFDPQRGHLLVYESSRDSQSGKCYRESYVTEAREYSGGRWFPMRVVVIEDPDRGPRVSVREVTVRDLDLDTRPAVDRFRVELAKDTHVNVIGRPAWTNLKQAETIRLQDLPALYKRCVDNGRARTRPRNVPQL